MALLSLPPPKASYIHLPNMIKPTTKTLFPASTTIYKHQNSSASLHSSKVILNDFSNSRRSHGNIKMKTQMMIPNYAESGKDSLALASDVVMMKTNWKLWDFLFICWVVAIHFLCLFAPFTFSWGAFWVAFSLYIITGLFGITFCYHRLLSHKSFKLPKWLEYVFAYCGVLAGQGNPMFWVSIHRQHHQFTDSEEDPHSPIKGFWFSHMTWFLDRGSLSEKRRKANNVGDLEKQHFYKFLESTYIIHLIALCAPLYAIGGFPYIVWGMGLRTVFLYHMTWLVNSIGHIWGTKAWNNDDLSRNNWWLAMLTFGEGWHNNHHAFEYSARHGLEWWQIDITWYVIRLLEIVGVATDVKLPTSAQKQKLAFTN